MKSKKTKQGKQSKQCKQSKQSKQCKNYKKKTIPKKIRDLGYQRINDEMINKYFSIQTYVCI